MGASSKMGVYSSESSSRVMGYSRGFFEGVLTNRRTTRSYSNRPLNFYCLKTIDADARSNTGHAPPRLRSKVKLCIEFGT